MTTPPGPEAARRLTLQEIAQAKRDGRPLVMVTAYDYPSGRVAERAGVDLVLVGDSGAMTVLGHSSTVPATMDEMLMLTAAVQRQAEGPKNRIRHEPGLVCQEGDRQRDLGRGQLQIGNCTTNVAASTEIPRRRG